MASSDNRSAFRLPWQSGHASETEADTATSTAVVDPPAWPSHDLARRQSRGTNGARGAEPKTTTDEPTADAAGTTDAATVDETTAAAEAATAPATAEAAMTADAATTVEAPTTPEPATDTETAEAMADGAAAATAPAEPATETPVEQRAPMTETLTRPAHDAVTDGQARRPTKFMLDLTRAMRQAAGEARQSALAQFRVDVEHHTAEAQAACEAAAAEARRRADEDITALAERETAEIARIRRETEEGIAARHARLETEIADQMARLDEEVARVRARVDAFEAEMDAFFQHLAQEDDPGRFAGLAEQLPEAPAFDAWTPEIGDAAPELTANDTAEDGAGEPAAGTATVADQPADPDAGMPPMLPDDFAAAEAEAAEWVAVDDASPEAEVAAEMTAATDTAPEADGEGAAPWPPASAAAAAVTTSVRTQVAVVGLVSVASIATFKRLLARSAGVHGVAVASGPDGEFLFTATHDSTLDMPATVAAIQGFDVEVMESGPGIVMARAVDPEVV